jgi:hypothetical protein
MKNLKTRVTRLESKQPDPCNELSREQLDALLVVLEAIKERPM